MPSPADSVTPARMAPASRDSMLPYHMFLSSRYDEHETMAF
jgi:hypothetical protein